MKKVEMFTEGYVGTFDCLDGKPLKQDERVYVRWGNGIEEQYSIVLTIDTKQYYGHGDSGILETHKAYINILYHGTEMLVRLHGTEILCERV